MLRKLFFKLSVVLDTIKSFLVFVIIWVLIIFFASMIIHNMLKIADMSEPYKGEYRNLVTVDPNKWMNVKIYGEGDNTIVILPEFGSQCPVLQYKGLAERLTGYRVAVVEYYGYGFSMKAEKERDLNNMTSEIKSALMQAGVDDFIVVSHGLSNLYAMKLIESYPSSILACISIDGELPERFKEGYSYDSYLKEYHNVQLTSLLEYSGFARILSYVQPDMFYMNTMREKGVWGDAEIKILRNRIVHSYLTESMVKEMKKSYDNSKELENFRFPTELPVLEILTSQYVNRYDDIKSQGLLSHDANEYATRLISNKGIQKVEELECDGGVQYTKMDELAQSIVTFLGTDFEYSAEDIIEEPIDVEEPEDVVENTTTNTTKDVVEITLDDNNNVVKDTTSLRTNEIITTVITNTSNSTKDNKPKPNPNMNRITGNVLYSNSVSSNRVTDEVIEEE